MATEPSPQTHTTPPIVGLTSTAEKKFQTIANKITHFAKIKKIEESEVSEAMRNAYHHIKGSTNQVKTARQFLKNIEDNQGTYSDVKDLLFRVKTVAPSASTAITSKGKKKGKQQIGQPSKVESKSEQSDTLSNVFTAYKGDTTDAETELTALMSLDSHIVDVETNKEKEPKISQSQLQHIKEVVKILEKHPALKNDIRRTITEELTKGYINHEQFKEYNTAIEEVQAKEAPASIRAKKTPKPRAKKSAQSDKAIIPMDIDTTSKLPKGKSKKDNQKKKEKVVVL